MPLLISSIILSSFLIRTGLNPHFTIGQTNVYPSDFIILFCAIFIFNHIFINNFKTLKCIATTIILCLLISFYQFLFKITTPISIIFPLLFFIYHTYRYRDSNAKEDLPVILALPFVYTILQLIRSISDFGLGSATNGARHSLIVWSTIVTFFLLSRNKNRNQIMQQITFAMIIYVLYTFFLLILVYLELIDSVSGVNGIHRYINSDEALLLSICSVFIFNKIFFNNANRLRYLLTSLCLFGGALFTCHRSVWIATFAGYGCLLYMNRKRNIKIIAILIFIVAFFLPLAPGRIFRNVSISFENAMDYKSGNTASWRIEGWKQLIVTAGNKNPIIGMGFGAPKTRVINHGGTLIEWDVSAHNQYVDAFYTGGFLGLMIELLFIFCIAWKIFKNIDSRSEETKTGFFSMLIVYAAYHFSYSLRSPFGIIIGLIAVYIYNNNSGTNSADNICRTCSLKSDLHNE